MKAAIHPEGEVYTPYGATEALPVASISAGEVLGESQSGEMQEIGFSLYNDMLAAAIASLKQGKEPDMAHPLGVTTEINLHTPALLPNDYCGDIHQRLVIYKRLAHCNTQQDLDDMHQE